MARKKRKRKKRERKPVGSPAKAAEELRNKKTDELEKLPGGEQLANALPAAIAAYPIINGLASSDEEKIGEAAEFIHAQMIAAVAGKQFEIKAWPEIRRLARAFRIFNVEAFDSTGSEAHWDGVLSAWKDNDDIIGQAVALLDSAYDPENRGSFEFAIDYAYMGLLAMDYSVEGAPSTAGLEVRTQMACYILLKAIAKFEPLLQARLDEKHAEIADVKRSLEDVTRAKKKWKGPWKNFNKFFPDHRDHQLAVDDAAQILADYGEDELRRQTWKVANESGLSSKERRAYVEYMVEAGQERYAEEEPARQARIRAALPEHLRDVMDKIELTLSKLPDKETRSRVIQKVYADLNRAGPKATEKEQSDIIDDALWETTQNVPEVVQFKDSTEVSGLVETWIEARKTTPPDVAAYYQAIFDTVEELRTLSRGEIVVDSPYGILDLDAVEKATTSYLESLGDGHAPGRQQIIRDVLRLYGRELRIFDEIFFIADDEKVDASKESVFWTVGDRLYRGEDPRSEPAIKRSDLPADPMELEEVSFLFEDNDPQAHQARVKTTHEFLRIAGQGTFDARKKRMLQAYDAVEQRVKYALGDKTERNKRRAQRITGASYILACGLAIEDEITDFQRWSVLTMLYDGVRASIANLKLKEVTAFDFLHTYEKDPPEPMTENARAYTCTFLVPGLAPHKEEWEVRPMDRFDFLKEFTSNPIVGWPMDVCRAWADVVEADEKAQTIARFDAALLKHLGSLERKQILPEDLGFVRKELNNYDAAQQAVLRFHLDEVMGQAAFEEMRKKKSTKKSHEASLSSYLDALTLAARPGSGLSHEERRVWAGILHGVRDARVFDVPPEVYITLSDTASNYALSAAGLDSFPNQDDDELEFTRKWQRLHYVRRETPLPEKLPFNNIFFGLGEGVIAKTEDGEDAHIHGVLLCRSGYVALLMTSHFKNEEGEIEEGEIEEGKGLLPIRSPEGWAQAGFPIPWILLSLIDMINDHNTFVVSTPQRSKSFNQSFRAVSKKYKHKKKIPEPYYLITLKRKLVRDTELDRLGRVAPTVRTPPDHRWDTRGHERVKVQRGKLPLDEKTRRKLSRRGYRIYELGGLSAADYERLMKRPDIPPKRPEEWLAIKHKWVDSYVNGPKDAPYVPGIRRMPHKERSF